jgi:hypothetical protein
VELRLYTNVLFTCTDDLYAPLGLGLTRLLQQ